MNQIPKVKSLSFDRESWKSKMLVVSLVFLVLVTFLISLAVGRYPIKVNELISMIVCKITGVECNVPTTVQNVFFCVRLPRIFAALIIGASLAVSGASYQGIFKNPMVSPDILGASSGAGFGAGLGILLSFRIIEIQLSAFFFGILAVLLTYFISSVIEKSSGKVLTMVLVGMVISTLFQSFLSMIKYVADPNSKLPAITFWLMGSISSINVQDLKILFIPLLLGLLPLMFLRWKLNIMSFGDEEAKAMGVNVDAIRVIVILCSTIMTSAVVAISGVIGWVGLIIPHFCRMIVGPDYKKLIPVSMVIGGCFLLSVDNLSRSLFSMELPIGILTAIIGAPFFIYLLIRGKKGWL